MRPNSTLLIANPRLNVNMTFAATIASKMRYGRTRDCLPAYGVTAPLAATLNVSTPFADVVSEPPGTMLIVWFPAATVTDTL
jgi:hypothetical protein